MTGWRNVCYIRRMTETIQDHKDFLTSLTADQRITLTKKNNHSALIRLSVLLSCAAILLALISLKISYWPLLMLPLGILLVFLFTLMHETTHATAFASSRLNLWVSIACGWILMLPPTWFRYFHLAHHRYTQCPHRDPELQSPKPTTWPGFLLHLSGIKIWWSALCVLSKNAMTRNHDSFVPPSALPGIRLESRLMLGSYLGCIALSITLGSTWLLTVWIVPIILGQPLLRLYLLAEHGGCALTQNMFDNTRTTFTTAAIRFLCWNMPYHTEHHVYPMVPFHQLPTLHGLLKQHLRHTENGYSRFSRRYARTLT